ncbi:MAG: hypothetical protein CMF34_01895 [Leeuwenhoekiella sp.]|nr:hypothetical protein [Leeuwenhoekiella sp.]MBH13578.1 hypothetical protein [Leeuwenhoekiella sp.]HAX15726.1 hypothetical protein [Leeuwenhoekiella sp.]|tara:strand:- start:15337 stop:16566 length:1230 start_codon:yes stop_codon:yes gene_type:complete
MIEILNHRGEPIAKAKNSLELAGKSQKVMLDLVRQQHSVYRQEISDYQMARLERLNTQAPATYLLQTLYKDVILDAHLTAVMENRILRIVNKRFVIKDEKGVADHERSEFLNRRWFTDTVRYVMESIFYEYSLIHWIKDVDGKILKARKIPREHVNPDRGIVVKSVYDQTGLPYEEFPFDLQLAKLYDGYGLLEKAAPLTILKRHSWASWDEFEQIFGMPIRIAKLGTMNDEVKNEVASWLKTMGTASYGVFPQFADIEIKEANNRDAFNVFMKKIETVDSQLSILVNGQTMTTQDGSSRSQAEVHENTQDELTEADLRNVVHWLNDNLVPVLRNAGYDIKDTERIGVEMLSDPIDKMKIDEKIMNNSGYRLTQKYLESTYGVELEPLPAPTPPKPGNSGKEDPEKKKE